VTSALQMTIICSCKVSLDDLGSYALGTWDSLVNHLMHSYDALVC